MTKLNQRGSHLVVIILLVLIIGVVGGTGYAVMMRNKTKTDQKPAGQTTQNTKDTMETSAAVDISWMQTADGYQPSSTPPACTNPIVSQFPADISLVTGVLYPGQYRGGNYKPHGGFRFDKASSNNVTVKAPFDGTIITGAAYLADNAGQDVQYTFDVMNSCGMMFRVGHLLRLSDEMKKLADKFPAPEANNSRTTNVNPGVKIKAGTVMGTAVGTSSDKNVFFDFGIYDWNQPNAASKDAAWQAGSQHDSALSKHAVCIFDQMKSSDKSKLFALPAGDPVSAKSSDYCK